MLMRDSDIVTKDQNAGTRNAPKADLQLVTYLDPTSRGLSLAVLYNQSNVSGDSTVKRAEITGHI
jgi:hypothetical protein